MSTREEDVVKTMENKISPPTDQNASLSEEEDELYSFDPRAAADEEQFKKSQATAVTSNTVDKEPLWTPFDDEPLIANQSIYTQQPDQQILESESLISMIEVLNNPELESSHHEVMISFIMDAVFACNSMSLQEAENFLIDIFETAGNKNSALDMISVYYISRFKDSGNDINDEAAIERLLQNIFINMLYQDALNELSVLFKDLMQEDFESEKYKSLEAEIYATVESFEEFDASYPKGIDGITKDSAKNKILGIVVDHFFELVSTNPGYTESFINFVDPAGYNTKLLEDWLHSDKFALIDGEEGKVGRHFREDIYLKLLDRLKEQTETPLLNCLDIIMVNEANQVVAAARLAAQFSMTATETEKQPGPPMILASRHKRGESQTLLSLVPKEESEDEEILIGAPQNKTTPKNRADSL